MDAETRGSADLAHLISHDLGAPARTIAGFAELLRTRRATLAEDKVDHYLQVIGEEARRLQEMVAELAAFVRLDSTVPHAQQVALPAAVAEALTGVAERRAGDEIDATAAEGATIVADPALLRTLLTTVIRHALTSRRGEAPVHVRIGVEPSTVVVDHDGLAVASDERERRTRLLGPGGLGLARALAERAGGDLRLADSPLGGCRVLVELPPAPSGAAT